MIQNKCYAEIKGKKRKGCVTNHFLFDLSKFHHLDNFTILLNQKQQIKS